MRCKGRPAAREHQEKHDQQVFVHHVSERYLDAEVYRPADDLIALVPHVQTLETMGPAGTRPTMNADKLTEHADYFNRPHYILPTVQGVQHKLQAYYSDGDLEHADDE